MAGLPPVVNDDIFAMILKRIERGDIVNYICDEPGMPGKSALYHWKNKTAENQQAWDDAMDARDDLMMERARKTLRMKGLDEGGETTGDVIRDKAIAHFDLQIVERRNKARWGASTTVRAEVSGSLRVQTEHEMTDAQLAAIIAGHASG